MLWVRPKSRDIALAIILYTMNLLDASFTLYIIDNGEDELNPLMAALINLGVIYFIAFKVLFVAALTALMLFLPLSSRVNTSLLVLSCVYTALTALHIIMVIN